MTNFLQMTDLKFAMLLVLAATDKGSEIKNQESVNKIRKHNCFFYETTRQTFTSFTKVYLFKRMEI